MRKFLILAWLIYIANSVFANKIYSIYHYCTVSDFQKNVPESHKKAIKTALFAWQTVDGFQRQQANYYGCNGGYNRIELSSDNKRIIKTLD